MVYYDLEKAQRGEDLSISASEKPPRKRGSDATPGACPSGGWRHVRSLSLDPVIRTQLLAKALFGMGFFWDLLMAF
jgi:hypothetical protein